MVEQPEGTRLVISCRCTVPFSKSRPLAAVAACRREVQATDCTAAELRGPDPVGSPHQTRAIETVMLSTATHRGGTAAEPSRAEQSRAEQPACLSAGQSACLHKAWYELLDYCATALHCQSSIINQAAAGGIATLITAACGLCVCLLACSLGCLAASYA